MTSPAPADRPDPVLAELRERIAEIDRRLLDAFNARLELVRSVRGRKRELGIPFVDPGQEARLVAALTAANGGPLSEAGLRELFSVVLALTKREVARTELHG